MNKSKCNDDDYERDRKKNLHIHTHAENPIFIYDELY